MALGVTNISFGLNDEKVDIKGNADRIRELIEDHLAADQMRRKKRGECYNPVQKLIFFKGAWHLASLLGTFSFFPQEAELLGGAKARSDKAGPDGRLLAEAWCRHDLSFICLVGAEEQACDLPPKPISS